MVKRSLILLLCLPVVLIGVAIYAATPSEPSPRPIPGLTAPDTHPQGCVSCHIDMQDIGVDARLSIAIRMWEEEVPPKLLEITRLAMSHGKNPVGKHPPVAMPLTNVPNSCLPCHNGTSEGVPAFGRLMHLVHYSGGNENHFLTIFGGECTLCHKMDYRTGEWSVPSGSEQQIYSP